MIEHTLKTNTGTIKVAIPGDISELTLAQLMQLQESTELNDLQAISILSGTSLSELQNVTDINDLHYFTDCIFLLSHQLKNLHANTTIPNQVYLTVDGNVKKVKVVKNLSVEPAGAFMAAGEVIGSEIQDFIKLHGEENWQERFNPSLNACCQVLAQYFYCRATGERYDEYKAEEFTEQVKQLKVTEALPIARYFFYGLSQLIENENRLLAAHISALEKKAGIQSFSKFKYINTVNSLAGGDVTKWADILNTPYDRLLTKLLLNKTEAEYQKRYSDLLYAQK